MAETTLIHGRYRLLDLIGRGGMGEVWRARDESLGRRVAVKCLKPAGQQGDRRFMRVLRERFRREARVAASLQHQGVTVVHDFGEYEGLLYLVMELLEGRNLSQLLEDNGRHPLPVPEVLDVAAQVAAALAYTHDQGIVHRDLKPANVVRTDEGAVKICDFGIARLGRDIGFTSKLTGGGIAMGTPHYMSPEQIAGSAAVDHRSDLYSLGCVLYELATGVPPFDHGDAWAVLMGHRDTAPEPPRTHRPGLPEELDGAILRLLAKDPEERPASAAELWRAVAAAGESAGVATGAVGVAAVPGGGLIPVRLPGAGAGAHAGAGNGDGNGQGAEGNGADGHGGGASNGAPSGSSRAASSEAPGTGVGAGTGAEGLEIPVVLPRLPAWTRGMTAGVRVRGSREAEASRPTGAWPGVSAGEDTGAPPPGDTASGGVPTGGVAALTGQWAAVAEPAGAGRGAGGVPGQIPRAAPFSPGAGTPARRGAPGADQDEGADRADASGVREVDEREWRLRTAAARRQTEPLPDAPYGEGRYGEAPYGEDPEDRSQEGIELGREGRWTEAAEVHRAVAEARARTLGADHPETLASRYEVGFALCRSGEYAAALHEYRRVAASRADTLGPEHPDTLAARQESAFVLGQLGHCQEAHQVYSTVLAVRERVTGPEHPDTLRCRHNLAFNLSRLGRAEDSCQVFAEVAAARSRVLGEEHPDTLVTRYEVAYALGRLGRWEEALETCRAVAAARARVLGDEHPDTLAARYETGIGLGRLGRSAEALELYEELAAARTRAQGPADPETLRARHGLGVNLGRLGRWDEALATAREVCALREEVLGPEHPDTLMSRREVAVALGWLGRWGQALEVYRQVTEARTRVLGPSHAHTLLSASDEAHCLERLGRYEEAAELQRRVDVLSGP